MKPASLLVKTRHTEGGAHRFLTTHQVNKSLLGNIYLGRNVVPRTLDYFWKHNVTSYCCVWFFLSFLTPQKNSKSLWFPFNISTVFKNKDCCYLKTHAWLVVPPSQRLLCVLLYRAGSVAFCVRPLFVCKSRVWSYYPTIATHRPCHRKYFRFLCFN